jgi:hypothetical protein
VAWGGPRSHPNPIFFIYKKLEEKKEKKKEEGKRNPSLLHRQLAKPNRQTQQWVTISGDSGSPSQATFLANAA